MFSTFIVAPSSSEGCAVSLGAFFSFDGVGGAGVCPLPGACTPPVRSFGFGAGCCERPPEKIKPIDMVIERRSVIVGRIGFMTAPLVDERLGLFASYYVRQFGDGYFIHDMRLDREPEFDEA
jgi:hypothetical protein